jgi:xylulokinase
MANVLNRPILKYANDDSSYGSALLAGVGAGIFSSHEEAVEKGLHLKERVEPDAKTAAKYQEIFKCYRELHDALTPLYHKF